MKYDISVIVMTYHPIWTKLKSTLLSILCQTGIHYEIIISDDGSEDTCFQQIETLFREHNFTCYKLIHAEQNHGTCKNYFCALVEAESEFVKPISPGDCLYLQNCLERWLQFMKKHKATVSFSNALFYNFKNGQFQIQQHSHIAPIDATVYDRHDLEACRIGCLVLHDFVLGATFLAQTLLLRRYCQKIIDAGVIYTEDTMFRWMLFHGIQIYHFAEDALLYEVGTGISTSKNKYWQALIQKDTKVVEQELLNEVCIDVFQKRYQMYIRKKCKMKADSYKWFRYICFPEAIKRKLQQKKLINSDREVASLNVDSSYLEKLMLKGE